MEDDNIASVNLHVHPIVDMRIGPIIEDDSGKYSMCSIVNSEFSIVESDFFLTEEKAIEIIEAMNIFLEKCK